MSEVSADNRVEVGPAVDLDPGGSTTVSVDNFEVSVFNVDGEYRTS